MSKKDFMDTQDLSEIRKMIGNISEAAQSNEGAFDLDDIIAEVSGTVEQAQGEKRSGSSANAQKRTSVPAQVKQTSVPAQVKQTSVPSEPTQKKQRSAAQRAEMPTQSGQENTIQASRTPSGAGQTSKTTSTAKDAPQAPAITIVPMKTVKDPSDVREEEPAKPQKQGRKERKRRAKEKQQAEREARRLAEEQEEKVCVRDPQVAMRSCKKRARGLAVRSVFVGILLLATAYLSVAGGFGWPLPKAVNYADSPVTCLLAMMLMQFGAMFIGIDIIGMGLYNLFRGAPDRKTLVTVANFASIAHGLTIILKPEWGGWLPYCAVSILILFAAMQEDKARFIARQRTFKAAAMAMHPIGICSYSDPRAGCIRATKTRMITSTPFLAEMERTDVADSFSNIYAPIVLAACVIFSLIVSIGKGEPSRFFWALSAMLSVSVPLGILCASGPAYRNVSRNLLCEGTALSSVRAAARLRKTRQTVLTDKDIFPAGSITIDGFQNLGKYTVEKVLSYAAAITDGQGLEIGRIFSESLREQYGKPVRATNILQYESGGLSADIGNDSVMVGTATFLNKLGVRLHGTQSVKNGVYVVINSQLAGVFQLTYHPTAQSYSALHTLCRLRMKPLLTTRDFNISPAMVESLFELRNGATAEEESRTDDSASDEMQSDAICGLVSRDGIAPFTLLLQTAEKLCGAVWTNLTVGTLSGVCGILLVFYLAFLFSITVLTPKNILLYLLLWYLPIFFMNLYTRKKY